MSSHKSFSESSNGSFSESSSSDPDLERANANSEDELFVFGKKLTKEDKVFSFDGRNC